MRNVGKFSLSLLSSLSSQAYVYVQNVFNLVDFEYEREWRYFICDNILGEHEHTHTHIYMYLQTILTECFGWFVQAA